MDAPEYVVVDVPSENFCQRMFYYTYYSNMDAHQYVHVDVPSVYTFYWMFYYTLHIDMDAPQLPLNVFVASPAVSEHHGLPVCRL